MLSNVLALTVVSYATSFLITENTIFFGGGGGGLKSVQQFQDKGSAYFGHLLVTQVRYEINQQLFRSTSHSIRHEKDKKKHCMNEVVAICRSHVLVQFFWVGMGLSITPSIHF
jgi:hypothetical protein